MHTRRTHTERKHTHTAQHFVSPDIMAEREIDASSGGVAGGEVAAGHVDRRNVGFVNPCWHKLREQDGGEEAADPQHHVIFAHVRRPLHR